MLLPVGGSVLSVEPLLSNDGSAAYVGIPSQLVDGRPGTPAVIQWTTGLQSTASYITVVFKITQYPVGLKQPPRLFCIVFNKLGDASVFKKGTVIQLVGGPTNNPTNVLRTTVIKELPDGRLGTWVYLPTQSNTWDYFGWRIYNDDGDTNYISSGELVEIGEVYGDAVVSYPLSTFSVRLVDPTRINRSSGNQPWMVMRVPFQRFDATISPRDFDGSFITAAGNTRQHMLRLARTKYIAVVLRDRRRGAAVVDDDYVQNMGVLCRITDLGGMQSDASNDYWPAPISGEELL